MERDRYMKDGKMDYEKFQNDVYNKIRYSQDEMAKEISYTITELVRIDDIRTKQYGEIVKTFLEIREDIKKIKEKVGLE